MENLFIAATASSPEVDFRFDTHELWLKGESYPEHAAAFYGPILDHVRLYLKSPPTAVTLNVQLAYFNSSSTKLLFTMLSLFNEAARAGCAVTLNWYHDVEDETLREFGQEVRQDYPALTIHDIAVE